jgi:hypothetical protein
VGRVWSLSLKSPAGELEVRDDGGADHAAGLDGDFQPTVPPQAEADVVGEVFVAVARLEHDLDLPRERKENNPNEKPCVRRPRSPRNPLQEGRRANRLAAKRWISPDPGGSAPPNSKPLGSIHSHEQGTVHAYFHYTHHFSSDPHHKWRSPCGWAQAASHFALAGMTAAAMSRASAQHARFMRASQSSKLTPTSASVAAYKGQPGTTIRLGISSGAGMCHGSALRRHNVADLKICSAASIDSATSTTTAGGDNEKVRQRAMAA